ncbi:hypothetical protein U9M48_037291 [Paspalum notatum var. saurae]|uniref:Uncharacterized protein n=1 Tax=Paspalum notatum var. saurae TaxID=547442 RepID=A0AAQ3UJ02_PASNO
MEDVWIMDSGCSRHMIGHRKWFSSLNPVSTKEYITFGDNGQSKVMGVGSVSLSAKLSLREIFRVDLTSVSGPARCLVASLSADIWKWHRRLGHLSFDLLVRAFRVWILEAKQVVETCEVSFDETMPCTTPAFELSSDDEESTPIFEDEEGFKLQQMDVKSTFLNGFIEEEIKQGLEGTFVHQAKYIRDILKKFNMGDSKPMTTPMSTITALDADEDGEAVDQKEFRGMIGSLLYLTATRPDIQFAVCLYARYQASPRTSHRQEVKRIFRLQVEGVDNVLIKGEIESQWTGLIALLGRIKGDDLKSMGRMEDTVVCSMLKIVGTKLAPLVIREFGSIAGDKAIRNYRSLNWLKELKHATYDAEDVVNEFYIEADKRDVGVGVKNTAVKYLWTKPKFAMFEWKTARKIKAIKKSFDAIVKRRSDYSTIVNSIPVDHPVPYTGRTIGEVPLWTIVDETSIFGRDQEKNRMISELTETNDQQRIKIVSVIGLGGSGKTTLAKLVFNDGNIIKKHFEVLMWIHVSREFSVEKLVEKLFESITGDKANQLPLQHVSRTISNKLARKRFLAILDDVWTEDRVDWERFMVHLKSGAPGSSILLTSRSRKVAEAVDSMFTYDMPFLLVENSWKVFKQCFGISTKSLDAEFLEVGIDIVNKCGGVPLAIKVIAGVLHVDLVLPKAIGKLKKLRTLELNGSWNIRSLPQSIGDCDNLRSL